MVTLLILIVMLGILVFVHEFGHFIVAKKCGVHVYEFAIGMGPKLFQFKRKNDPTVYSIRLLPLGGYCALAGEIYEETDKKLPKNKFMCNKKPYQRFLILVAGVTMNFILAFVLFFMQGLIWGSSSQLSYVGEVTENSAIEKSGIEAGDRIISINGLKTNTWDKIQIALALNNEKESYDFIVKKQDGSIKKYEIVPDIIKNEDNEEIMKFGFGAYRTQNKGIITSIKYALLKFYSVISSMAIIIVKLFTGELGLKSLAGPVGMYTVVNESAKLGIENLIFLTAYLSVNLGFINILPFPAFDGGRILFLVFEKIKGSPVNPKIESWVHGIGFGLLMLLMLLITYQDILRLIK